MKKIREFVIKNSKLIVLIGLLLLIPSFIGYKATKINYDILVYLPEDIETIEGQNILANDFGIGAFSFVLTDNMDEDAILDLEEQIKDIKGVNLVISLADVTSGIIPIDMLPDDIINRLYNNEETVIAVTFSSSMSSEVTLKGIEQMREMVKKAEDVSGMSAMILDTRNLSEKEIIAYVLIAVILCLLVLAFATDSYFVPVLLLGNIGVAIVYNMGTNIIFGNISYITKAISAVLQLGVTTDFSIFLYHKYEEAKKTMSKEKAMDYAISNTFESVMGSSLTTVAGFLALCAMNLTLGKDIGLVMAKGVICGLICVLTLLPALLLVFDNIIQKTKHKEFLPKFKTIQNFVVKHYKLIVVIFILLLVPAWYGNKNVNVYYKLDESLPKDLASSVANSALAEKFNIVSPQIVLLDKDIPKDELDSLIEKLKNVDKVDLVLSPKAMLDYGMPSEMLPNDIAKIIENDKYQIILLNSLYEVASDELNEQIDDITKIVKKTDENAIIAGEGALMKDLTKISDEDFKNVNYLSIAVIFVLMFIVLRSASLPFILLFVIEFAIFVNMAVAFYTNNTLPFIASIVIGTIQLGATIDYAILMSNRYIEERLKNDKMTAIKNTLSSTIPSIITSALCFFAATIGVFVYSKIDMIGAICRLLSRGSIISMLVVVLILPSLLIILDKLICKTTHKLKEVK